MAKFEHPGCEVCTCPKGMCAGETPDMVAFMLITRGIKAYTVACAMNGLRSGIDFKGCSKSQMARVWEDRHVDLHYKMQDLTNENLKTALAQVLKGDSVDLLKRPEATE